MSLLNLIAEGSRKKYRIYKKSRETYRVEERFGDSWKELHEDEVIKRVIAMDCRMVIDEDGRQDTLSNTGQSSSDVAVHAWIECDSYKIHQNINNYDGILHYNPYAVNKFVDRKSFESGDPIVIEEADVVSADGNVLVYKGATKTVIDKGAADDNMHLIRKDESSGTRCYLEYS